MTPLTNIAMRVYGRRFSLLPQQHATTSNLVKTLRTRRWCGTVTGQATASQPARHIDGQAAAEHADANFISSASRAHLHHSKEKSQSCCLFISQVQQILGFH